MPLSEAPCEKSRLRFLPMKALGEKAMFDLRQPHTSVATARVGKGIESSGNIINENGQPQP
jgi:hypothetical protein